MLTTGKLIRKLRIRAGKTQVELAKELGYDDAVIRRHESGRGNAKADTLQKYAEALNVNPESLLCADLNSTRAMHHLFRIFDAYKGEFHTVTTTVTDENGNQIEKETVAISFDMLNEFMKEWKSVYEKSASPDPEVSEKADYDYYVYNFPESSDIDQTYKDMLIEYDNKISYVKGE